MKHTNEPWRVGKIENTGTPNAHYPIEAYYEDDGRRFCGVVATVPTWSFDGVTDDHREEHIANARLIACAPKLLRALHGLMDCLGRDGYHPEAGSPACSFARNVLREAETDDTPARQAARWAAEGTDAPHCQWCGRPAGDPVCQCSARKPSEPDPDIVIAEEVRNGPTS